MHMHAQGDHLDSSPVVGLQNSIARSSMAFRDAIAHVHPHLRDVCDHKRYGVLACALSGRHASQADQGEVP